MHAKRCRRVRDRPSSGVRCHSSVRTASYRSAEESSNMISGTCETSISVLSSKSKPARLRPVEHCRINGACRWGSPCRYELASKGMRLRLVRLCTCTREQKTSSQLEFSSFTESTGATRGGGWIPRQVTDEDSEVDGNDHGQDTPGVSYWKDTCQIGSLSLIFPVISQWALSDDTEQLERDVQQKIAGASRRSSCFLINTPGAPSNIDAFP